MKTEPRSRTAQLTDGQFLGRKTGYIRGFDVADSVAPSKKAPYEWAQEVARSYLEGHHHAGKARPEWYVIIEAVAQYQSWDGPQFRPLVDEGASRFPFCLATYRAGPVNHTPRWNGDYATPDDFAKPTAARRIR